MAGKKLRFEIFKRDDFTCQYCGRGVPLVVLELDHILPRKEGGGDEIENLITSCFDCNRGKGATPLDGASPLRNLPAETALIKEREEQLRAYHAVLAAKAERIDDAFAEVWDYWFELWETESLEKWHLPWQASLRRSVSLLGVSEVKEAMDIAVGKFSRPSAAATKYLGGILKRKLGRLEGRIVPCTICGKDIFLEPSDNPASGWHHGACREAKGG